MNKKNLMRFVLSMCLLAVCCLPLTAQGTNIRGDVNDDGTLNISDVTALINYLLTDDASSINLANADLNADGFWNISDVTTLTDILLRCDTFTVNGVVFNMVHVQAGTFIMGSDEPTLEPGPAHEVTLTKNYRIGETEVTQELWLAVMGSNPSYHSPEHGIDEDLRRPVENMTWDNCQEFITKLNELTGKTFRLPTEAEWEFAARGGNLSHGYQYSGSDDHEEVAWDVLLCYDLTGHGFTQPVATRAPNELGIYDMSGNVWEWCQDWASDYTSDPLVDPTGPETGVNHIVRGGSVDYHFYYCLVTVRDWWSVRYFNDDVGLRLAL